MSSSDTTDQACGAFGKKADTFQKILQESFGLDAKEVVSLERGYTNHSYSVRTDEARYVLRQSWQGKTSTQVHCESEVLEFLQMHSQYAQTPQLVCTVLGAKYLERSGEYWHLFRFIEGDSPYLWKEKCREPHSREIMRLLASLHGQLVGLSVAGAICPLRLLEQSLRSLENEASSIFSNEISLTWIGETLTEFAKKGHRILHRVSGLSAFDEPLLWCHSDFQLENFLFAGDEVVGIVDFDAVRTQPRTMDLAFALFHMSRDATSDVKLCWDDIRWHQCIRYYCEYDASYGEDAQPYAEDWRELFCLDQALIHLHAHRNKIWQLREGIGFLGPYREVLQA